MKKLLSLKLKQFNSLIKQHNSRYQRNHRLHSITSSRLKKRRMRYLSMITLTILFSILIIFSHFPMIHPAYQLTSSSVYSDHDYTHNNIHLNFNNNHGMKMEGDVLMSSHNLSSPQILLHSSASSYTEKFKAFITNNDQMIKDTDQTGDFNNNPFSVHLSTEENYSSTQLSFYGSFKEIRQKLDYTYHSNYIHQRQLMQDEIISQFLYSNHNTQYDTTTTTNTTTMHNKHIFIDEYGQQCLKQPYLVFTAGAMGAGKTYTLNSLHKHNRFPLSSFIRVDPDAIRQLLPEYELYVQQDPYLVGELTRKEAGYIVEILTLAAIEEYKNVVVDGSLRDYSWYEEYIVMLRRDYPYLKVGLLHIMAPRDVIFDRAMARGQTTGRYIPPDILELSIEQVPKSVKILKKYVDYFYELRNVPDADDIELLLPTTTNSNDYDYYDNHDNHLSSSTPTTDSYSASNVEYKNETQGKDNNGGANTIHNSEDRRSNITWEDFRKIWIQDKCFS